MQPRVVLRTNLLRCIGAEAISTMAGPTGINKWSWGIE